MSRTIIFLPLASNHRWENWVKVVDEIEHAYMSFSGFIVNPPSSMDTFREELLEKLMMKMHVFGSCIPISVDMSMSLWKERYRMHIETFHKVVELTNDDGGFSINHNFEINPLSENEKRICKLIL